MEVDDDRAGSSSKVPLVLALIFAAVTVATGGVAYLLRSGSSASPKSGSSQSRTGAREADPAAQQFWAWFAKNRTRLDEFRRDREDLLDEVSKALHTYCDGLAFEISSPENGVREFVVSADGVKKFFPAVETLCASAPPLPGWKVVAFRQRMDLGFAVNYEGKKFDPSEMWFASRTDEGAFDLTVYLGGGETRREVLGGVFLLLDIALGEYDVATGVRHIEIAPLPADPEKAGLVPFVRLRETFDRFKGRTR